MEIIGNIGIVCFMIAFGYMAWEYAKAKEEKPRYILRSHDTRHSKYSGKKMIYIKGERK